MARRLIFDLQSFVDVIGEKTYLALVFWKVPNFVDGNDGVPHLDGFFFSNNRCSGG